MRPTTITAFAARGHTRRSLLSRAAPVLTLGALLGTIACSGSDSSTGPSPVPDPPGISGLIQIDRSRVPAELFHARYHDANLDHTGLSLQTDVGTDGTARLSSFRHTP